MTTKKTVRKRTTRKKALPKKAARSRPAPTEAAIVGHASDGRTFKCDRNAATMKLRVYMNFAVALSKMDSEKYRHSIGECLLLAAFYALWRTASDLTTSADSLDCGDGLDCKPWDLLVAFADALDSYKWKEVRTLGEAFGIPDHKGRISTYGARRVVRDGSKVPREYAIVTDCLERFEAGKNHGDTWAEVGKLHGVGAERLRKEFKRLSELALDPHEGIDPRDWFDPEIGS